MIHSIISSCRVAAAEGPSDLVILRSDLTYLPARPGLQTCSCMLAAGPAAAHHSPGFRCGYTPAAHWVPPPWRGPAPALSQSPSLQHQKRTRVQPGRTVVRPGGPAACRRPRGGERSQFSVRSCCVSRSPEKGLQQLPMYGRGRAANRPSWLGMGIDPVATG
jgi:hypothetical protein